MNDEKVIEIMKAEIEKLIREKTKNDFDTVKGKDRKIIAKEIIKKLEEVLDNEDKED